MGLRCGAMQWRAVLLAICCISIARCEILCRSDAPVIHVSARCGSDMAVASNGTAGECGGTWATACSSLSHAMSIAPDRATILLHRGKYLCDKDGCGLSTNKSLCILGNQDMPPLIEKLVCVDDLSHGEPEGVSVPGDEIEENEGMIARGSDMGGSDDEQSTVLDCNGNVGMTFDKACVRIHDLTFRNCKTECFAKADQCAAALLAICDPARVFRNATIRRDEEMELKNVRFEECGGGASVVHLAGAAAVEVTDCVFEHCEMRSLRTPQKGDFIHSGMALQVTRAATASLTNTTVRHCRAVLHSQKVRGVFSDFWYVGNLHVTNCTFEHNEAELVMYERPKVYGGALYINDGWGVHIIDSTFVNHTVRVHRDEDSDTDQLRAYGGAVCTKDVDVVHIRSSDIVNNTLTINDDHLNGAWNEMGGGGLAILTSHVAELSNLLVDNNFVGDQKSVRIANTTTGGGGVYALNVTHISFDDIRFKRNSAASSQGASGGALSVFQAEEVEIRNSTFLSDRISSQLCVGGCISMQGVTDVQIQGATLLGCTAQSSPSPLGNLIPTAAGGAIGILAIRNRVLLEESVIRGSMSNSSLGPDGTGSASGGGLYLQSGSDTLYEVLDIIVNLEDDEEDDDAFPRTRRNVLTEGVSSHNFGADAYDYLYSSPINDAVDDDGHEGDGCEDEDGDEYTPAHAVISNCDISGNRALASLLATGGGLYAMDLGTVLITNSSIDGNGVRSFDVGLGGGMSAFGVHNFVIDDSVISENTAEVAIEALGADSFCGGGGIMIGVGDFYCNVTASVTCQHSQDRPKQPELHISDSRIIGNKITGISTVMGCGALVFGVDHVDVSNTEVLNQQLTSLLRESTFVDTSFPERLAHALGLNFTNPLPNGGSRNKRDSVLQLAHSLEDAKEGGGFAVLAANSTTMRNTHFRNNTIISDSVAAGSAMLLFSSDERTHVMGVKLAECTFEGNRLETFAASGQGTVAITFDQDTAVRTYVTPIIKAVAHALLHTVADVYGWDVQHTADRKALAGSTFPAFALGRGHLGYLTLYEHVQRRRQAVHTAQERKERKMQQINRLRHDPQPPPFHPPPSLDIESSQFDAARNDTDLRTVSSWLLGLIRDEHLQREELPTDVVLNDAPSPIFVIDDDEDAWVLGDGGFDWDHTDRFISTVHVSVLNSTFYNNTVALSDTLLERSGGSEGGCLFVSVIVLEDIYTNFDHQTVRGALDVHHSTFSDCHADGAINMPTGGGALWTNVGVVHIADCIFEHSSATDDNAMFAGGGYESAGGCAWIDVHTLKIEATEFVNCTTKSHSGIAKGGGVKVGANTFQVRNSTFRNNRAIKHVNYILVNSLDDFLAVGGGIVWYPYTTVTNRRGVYNIDTKGIMIADGVVFEGNNATIEMESQFQEALNELSAGELLGDIFDEIRELLTDGLDIQSSLNLMCPTCRALGGGLATYRSFLIPHRGYASVVLDQCSFTSNNARGTNSDGGGAWIQDSAITNITNSRFIRNVAGPELEVFEQLMNVSRSEVLEKKLPFSSQGGGISLVQSAARHVWREFCVASITESTFEHNTASWGGGIHSWYGLEKRDELNTTQLFSTAQELLSHWQIRNSNETLDVALGQFLEYLQEELYAYNFTINGQRGFERFRAATFMRSVRSGVIMQRNTTIIDIIRDFLGDIGVHYSDVTEFPIRLVNSTIRHNTALGAGGGVYVEFHENVNEPSVAQKVERLMAGVLCNADSNDLEMHDNRAVLFGENCATDAIKLTFLDAPPETVWPGQGYTMLLGLIDAFGTRVIDSQYVTILSSDANGHQLSSGVPSGIVTQQSDLRAFVYPFVRAFVEPSRSAKVEQVTITVDAFSASFLATRSDLPPIFDRFFCSGGFMLGLKAYGRAPPLYLPSTTVHKRRAFHASTTVDFVPCPPGYVPAKGAIVSTDTVYYCSKCPVGSYNLDGYSECLDCPSNEDCIEQFDSIRDEIKAAVPGIDELGSRYILIDPQTRGFGLPAGIFPLPTFDSPSEVAPCIGEEACKASKCEISLGELREDEDDSWEGVSDELSDYPLHKASWMIDCSACDSEDMMDLSENECHCSKGYEDRLCSRCTCDGIDECWYEGAADGECVKCEKFGIPAFVAALVLLSFIAVTFIVLIHSHALLLLAEILLVIVLVLLDITDWWLIGVMALIFLSQLVSDDALPAGLIKQFISYFNMTSILMPIAAFPPFAREALERMRIASLKFSNLTCLWPAVFSNPANRWLFQMFVPLILAGGICWLLVARYYLQKLRWVSWLRRKLTLLLAGGSRLAQLAYDERRTKPIEPLQDAVLDEVDDEDGVSEMGFSLPLLGSHRPAEVSDLDELLEAESFYAVPDYNPKNGFEVLERSEQVLFAEDAIAATSETPSTTWMRGDKGRNSSMKDLASFVVSEDYVAAAERDINVHEPTKKKKKVNVPLRFVLLRTLLFTLYAFHWDMCVLIFGALQPCLDDYMQHYQWIKCDWDWGLFMRFQIQGIVFLLLYVLGVPLLLAFVLFRFRRRILSRTSWKRENPLEFDGLNHSIGFLYDNYRDSKYWYEFAWIIRRILITSARLFPHGSSIQIFCISVHLSFFIWLHQYQRPYLKRVENWMGLCSAYVELITFTAGSYIAAIDGREGTGAWDTLTLIVQHCLLWMNISTISLFCLMFVVKPRYMRVLRKQVQIVLIRFSERFPRFMLWLSPITN